MRRVFKESGLKPAWIVFLVLLGCLAPMFFAWAMTPEGTVIGNSATATYTDEENNEYTTTSNIVQTIVVGVCAVEITVDRTAYDVVAGQDVYIPLTVKNIGNSTQEFEFTAITGSAYTVNIYRDSNQNGERDTAEPLIYDGGATSNPFDLNMEESAYFLAEVQVPVGTADGTIDTFNMTVTSTDAALAHCTENSPDIATTVIDDALMVVTKQVDLSESVPGGVLTYRVSFINIGNQPARSQNGWPIDIDDNGSIDAGVEGIFLVDDIPDGADYYDGGIDAGTPVSGFVIYSSNGTDFFQSVVNAGGAANISHIGFFIPDSDPLDDVLEDLFARDQEGFLTYQVTVEDPFLEADEHVDNMATLNYNDSTDTAQQEDSNWVHTKIPSSATADVSVGGTTDWAWNGGIGVWENGGAGLLAEEDDPPTNAAGTGPGYNASSPEDYTDPTLYDNAAMNVPAGTWVTFQHQVGNNDNVNEDSVSVTYDATNLPTGAIVEIWNADGTVKLTDPDADGMIDIGEVAALGTLNFTVKVFIPANTASEILDGTVDYYVDVIAHSTNNSGETDYSRDIIDGITRAGVDIAGYDLTAMGAGPVGNLGGDESAQTATGGHGDPSDGNTDGAADGDDIVEPATPDDVLTHVDPGDTIIYPLQILNTGQSPDTYSLSATLPSGTPEEILFSETTRIVFYEDPDCSNGQSLSGDEFEMVDTPLLGGTSVTAVAGTTLTVTSLAGFAVGDDVVVGFDGVVRQITAIDTTAKTMTLNTDPGAAAGDQVSESLCLLMAIQTQSDTPTGDYNIIVETESDLSGVSDDMDVFVHVNAICAISVAPDGSDQLPPGGTTTYSHTITNSGNYDVDVQIVLTAPSNALLNYYLLDSGGNQQGALDPYGAGNNDFVWDYGTLAEGASLTFYVKVFASAAVPEGTVEDIEIIVNSYAVGGPYDYVTTPGDIICSDDVMDTTTIIKGFLLLTKRIVSEVDVQGPDATGACVDDPDGDTVAGDGIVPGPCDNIIYSVRYENIGEQDAINVVLQDIIPEHTDYVVNTLGIDTDCNDVADSTPTDGIGDGDTGEYDNTVSPPVVRFYVGTGASDSAGGTVAPDEYGCIMFTVKIR